MRVRHRSAIAGLFLLPLTSLAVPRAVSAAEPGKPDFEIQIKHSGPNNVLVFGETVAFPVVVKNKTREERTEAVKLSLRDYFGKTIELSPHTVTLKPGALAETAFEFTPSTTGHYTPVARVGKVEKQGYPVGVVPEPVEGARPLSIFGVSAQLSRSRRDWELMRLMGVKWIRGDMAWPHFQKKRDEWLGGYDGVVKIARELQIGIMATPGYTQNFAAQEFEWSKDFGPPPRWVAARHTAPVKPECLRDWEQYIYRLVKDYGDVARYWELWNEADLNFYYGTPGDYMAMHKAAWCAVKKADPDAPLIGGNSCICPYFIQRVLPDGFLEYTDIMAVHYPFSFDTPIKWNRPVSGYNRPYLERAGYRKAIEMTEGGNLIYRGRGEPFGINDASHKTRILVKEHMFNCQQQQGKFYQFTFKSHPGWGFLPRDARYPYAHFVSHAVMAKVLEDADYVGHLDLGSDISAFVFSRGMEPVTVMWKGSYINPAGETDTELEAGAREVTRIDLMGGSSVLKSPRLKNRGRFRLHLDEDPIYIVGGDRRLFARALAERMKPILSDLRRLAAKVAPAESVGFVEDLCRTAGRRAELLRELKYREAAEPFPLPLEQKSIAALLKAAHEKGRPVPAFNLLHKLCDLAEILWLQRGVAQARAKGRELYDGALLTDAEGLLASVKAEFRKAWGAASQPRVCDLLYRARQVLALAQRSKELNHGEIDALAVGRVGFAGEMVSAATVLAAFDPRVALSVYLSLDLPSSVHWGGRWEKKLLIKPLGEALTFPAAATVHNRLTGATAKGRIRLSAPDGWSVVPETIDYEVAADKDNTYRFQVTVPADNPFLPYEDDLRLTGELAGDTLFPATQQIEVVPPLWTDLRFAGTKFVDVRSSDEVMDITGAKVAVVGESGKIGQSDVTVRLRNRGQRSWAGKVKLVLPPGWAAKPDETAFPAIEHYRKAEVKFTVFYPSDASPGPQYPILARAVAADGKLIGMGVTGHGGNWRFKVGSESEWKAKDFDDSKWEERSASYYQQQGYVGDVWFRQKMFVPEGWGKENLLLNLGVPCMAIEVFFNGQKVGQMGQWPPEWIACWGDIANFVVKRELVETGGWNTIAVRVFVPCSQGGITPGFLRPVR